MRSNVNVNNNVQISASPAAIPSLSEYGLLVMSMAGKALWRQRHSR